MKNKTLKEILKMDVKSDEFFEIYKLVSDKYWSFDGELTDAQKACSTLVMFAERYEIDKVILCHKIIEQIIKFSKDKTKAGKLHLVFSDQEYYVDIYENERSKDNMDSMLSKASKAMESGNVKIKNKFGKNYFKPQ